MKAGWTWPPLKMCRGTSALMPCMHSKLARSSTPRRTYAEPSRHQLRQFPQRLPAHPSTRGRTTIRTQMGSCYPWNWGKDCGFQGSHSSSSDALLHICACCAYKFRRQLKHKEEDYMKKNRFIDKKAASDTSTNTVSVSKAFC